MRGLRKVAVHFHAHNDILVTIVVYLPPAVLRAAADPDQTHRAWLEVVAVAVPESVTEAVLLVTAVVVTVAGLEAELAVPEGARGADNQGLV
jgi:hypothetical protein